MNDAARDDAYKYNGKEWDETMGLYDYGARWYDPTVGRWTSIDPKAHWYYDISPYAYVANNPISQYDPNGEFIGTIVGAIVGGVTAAIRGENILKGIVSGAAAGAVVDLAVATGGTSLVVMVAAGAASGAVGNYVDQRLNGISHQDVSWGNVGRSAALGGVLSYVGMKVNLAPVVQRAQGWLGRQLSRGLSRFQKTEIEAGPLEPYNRRKHYGNSPTAADRRHFGAGPDEVVDHNPSLVERYYKGDPSTGEPPGYKQTPTERRASANDRRRMRKDTRSSSDAQGGSLSQFSKEQKKFWFGRGKN